MTGTLRGGLWQGQDTLCLGQLWMLWSQWALNKHPSSECPWACGPGAGSAPLKAWAGESGWKLSRAGVRGDAEGRRPGGGGALKLRDRHAHIHQNRDGQTDMPWGCTRKVLCEGVAAHHAQAHTSGCAHTLLLLSWLLSEPRSVHPGVQAGVAAPACMCLAGEGLGVQAKVAVHQSSHLLNRRMAMTMRTMRMTARTGPVTHSSSGSSCCWTGVTWTTISSE